MRLKKALNNEGTPRKQQFYNTIKKEFSEFSEALKKRSEKNEPLKEKATRLFYLLEGGLAKWKQFKKSISINIE